METCAPASADEEVFIVKGNAERDRCVREGSNVQIASANGFYGIYRSVFFVKIYIFNKTP